MKEPEKIPLDPSTPRAKSVNKIPLTKLYPESISDDIYDVKSNSNNENSKKSTET